MSKLLRHKPKDAALDMEKDGFVDLGELYTAVQSRYRMVYSYDDMIQTLLTPSSDGTQRFEIRNSRARARYGHSIEQVIEHPQAVPPPVLYHGTTERFLEAIHQDGLKPGKRQYVHLAVSVETALRVGKRHGTPVLLTVQALDAHESGIVFYQPDDLHYLVKALPPQFIEFPEPENE
jgi:putative RNA 2'-phosphotransferase